MKTIAIVVGGVFLIGVIGFSGLQIMKQTTSKSNPTSANEMKEELDVVKVGKLQKAEPEGDDYTHFLMTTENDLIKLNSYTVDFSVHEGKTVEVKGQYSGNTLFVDVLNLQ
ncbi:hypothetical protein ACFL1P_00100 [Patescibacteria group bacterium]